MHTSQGSASVNSRFKHSVIFLSVICDLQALVSIIALFSRLLLSRTAIVIVCNLLFLFSGPLTRVSFLEPMLPISA